MIWLLFLALSPPPPYTVEVKSGNCSQWRSCNFDPQGCCPSSSGQFDPCCCLETNMLVNFEHSSFTELERSICCQEEAIQTSIFVNSRNEYDVYCTLPTISGDSPQWWEGDNLIIIVVSGSVVVIIIVILLVSLFRELTPEQVDSIAGLVTAVGDSLSDTKEPPPQPPTRFIGTDQVLADIQRIKSKQKRDIQVY